MGVVLTLKEERTFGVFENRMLRRIFGPKGMKWHDAGDNCTMRSSIICTVLHRLLEWSNQEEWDSRECSIRGDENYTQNLFGKPGRKRALGKSRCTWRIILKRVLRKWSRTVRSGFMWLGSGFVWTRWWTSGFRTRRGILWIAERQLASDALCSL
jgi:hypothetical protein